VKSGGESGDKKGLNNKAGSTNLKGVEMAVHSAEDAGKEKTEKFRREGNLEGPGKVLLHDGADEEGDEAKRKPQDKIDSPETWGVKKTFPKQLQHGDNVEKNQGWSTQEKSLHRLPNSTISMPVS